VAGVTALAGFTWVTLKSMSAVQEMRKTISDVADRLNLLPLNGTHERT
jgi:hypothetical protein